MNVSAVVCIAHGSEEIEAVTTVDLMVRGGIRVTMASVSNDNNLTITCSRGIKILADAPLDNVINDDYDIMVLPGGLKGAECFHNNQSLIQAIRNFRLSGRIVAAICAVPGMVLVPHNLFPTSKMTGFPALKDMIPQKQWVDKRVFWDQHAKLLTSQGPGTSIDFALKIIDLLIGGQKAYEVASELAITVEDYNFI